MKKSTLLALLLLPFMAFAQINLESDYSHSGAYTNLATSGYKFFTMDVENSQCKIYNVNHSLWKTIDLDVPAGQYLYDIKYVSENLFTDDNSLSLCYIYYLYDETFQYYTYTMKIVNENGTNLKTIEGAQYVYVNDLGDEGTKLVVYVYDYSFYPYSITTLVYDLPGQLTSSSSDSNSDFEVFQQNAFPNPAAGYSVIPFTLPENSQSGQIVLSDSDGKQIQSYTVDHYFDNLRINTAQLPRGIYFYHLESDNYKSEARKIIVN